MRKVRSMVAAVLLVIVSVCCFAGCSKKLDVVGKWDLVEMTADGQTVTAEQLKALAGDVEMYAEFTEDGKVILSIMGETGEGTYAIEGEEVPSAVILEPRKIKSATLNDC